MLHIHSLPYLLERFLHREVQGNLLPNELKFLTVFNLTFFPERFHRDFAKIIFFIYNGFK